MNVAATVQGILVRHPGITVRELRTLMLAAESEAPAKSELNSHLYRHAMYERVDTGALPKWYLAADPAAPARSPEPTRALVGGLSTTTVARQLSLFPWQVRALERWQAQDHRGVVEAVTGAGKTRVALAAAALQISAGGRAAVLAHTHELVKQWATEMQQLSALVGRSVSVGAMGGGGYEHAGSVDVLVATAQSAARAFMWRDGTPGLLIADEVHHYGAPAWSAGLEEQFAWRLGLTATFERDDNGVEDFLEPYFGGVCYSVGYVEALQDGVIAPFRIGFVGVRLSSGEFAEYEELSLRVARNKRRLTDMYGIPEEPFGVFMQAVAGLHRRGGEAGKWAGFYLGAFQKRRKLLAAARAKIEALPSISSAIQTADRTILFAQTREAAAKAVSALAAAGIQGDVLDSKLDIHERHQVFSTFERGATQLLAAPRLLDEGINVPAADLAIVLASSRSRRQMIQRMGRVVRPKPDGRHARVAIFYAEGTSEDPTQGAHEDFIDAVRDAAEEIEYFPSSTNPDRINDYLKQGPVAP